MNLFATHVITPSGEILFDEIIAESSSPLMLINKGIKSAILSYVKENRFQFEIHQKLVEDEDIFHYYQNFGDIIVVVTTNEAGNYDKVLNQIAYEFLRHYDSNDPRINTQDSHGYYKPFKPFYDKIVAKNKRVISTKQNANKTLTTASILDIPMENRKFALYILTNNITLTNIEKGKIMIDLNIDEKELNNQIEFMKSQNYI